MRAILAWLGCLAFSAAFGQVASLAAEADFETFAGMMRTLKDRKVLVHCEAVTNVWQPHDAWRRLIEEQLRKHKIAFDPF